MHTSATRTLVVRVLVFMAVLSGSAAAQTIVPGPPGPYVIDIRGAMVGVPQSAAFYPTVPSGTVVPARGFGIEAGAHVYPFSIPHARIGFGISVSQIRGTATTVTPAASAGSSSSSPAASSSSTTSVSPVSYPDIRTSEQLIAPQISFNFGTRDGWSYLSAGYGFARITTDAIGVVTATIVPTTPTGATTPAATLAPPTIATTSSNESMSQRRGAVNVGGGARWFLRDHLAVGFDVRFYRIRSATMVGLAAGFSVR